MGPECSPRVLIWERQRRLDMDRTAACVERSSGVATSESRLCCHKQLEPLLPWGSQREHGFSLLASKTVREACVFLVFFFFF